VHERTLELLGEYTAHNAAWWKNLDETKPEQWYTAKQMKQHGIIDEIYSAEAVKDLGYK
jgi:ATP-dependent protease ClpP protease subunit